MRDYSRPRDNRPANGTYRDDVAAPLDPAVARARFGVFVDRALKTARDRGMTDKKIYEASGVASSTFHRWRLGQGQELPQISKVRAFCAAVGASVDDAMKALGMTDAEPEPTPEPPMPRDVRIILRQLADPNIPEEQKTYIRWTLQMLATRAAGSRRNPSDEEQAG